VLEGLVMEELVLKGLVQEELAALALVQALDALALALALA
jgi:hypothetical protein